MDTIIQHFALRAEQLNHHTYCRKHAEFENEHPDALRGPNKPETAKKAIYRRGFEKSRCCSILCISCSSVGPHCRAPLGAARTKDPACKDTLTEKEPNVDRVLLQGAELDIVDVLGNQKKQGTCPTLTFRSPRNRARRARESL